MSDIEQNLLDTAHQAVLDLRKHISGDAELIDDEIDARRALIVTACHQSFYFFAKSVLKFDKLTKQTHKRWADELQNTWLKTNYFGRLKPRGTFKTTLYGEAFILWIWATVSPEIRFMYTSANETLLDEVAAHLDNYVGFDTESVYFLVFGIKRDKKARKNTQEIFNIIGRDKGAKGSSLMFRTAGGSTNGVHPHFIIIDDPMDNKDRDSEATRRSKERWFDSLVPLLVEYDKLGFPIKKMLFIATRWHLDDLVNYIQKKSDLWTFEIESVYQPDGSLSFPEFLGEDKISEIRSNISLIFFSCQYLNNPLPEGERVFEEEKMFFMRPEQYNIAEGSNYCFFDPSQGKKGSDFPAAVWFNVLNGRRVMFWAADKKIGLAAQIKLIARYNKEFGVRTMVFETNGTTVLEETIFAAHQEIQHTIYLVGIHETRNKIERINSIQPDLYNGTWFFRTDYKKVYPEAMSQVLFFPVWAKRDFPDVIEKAISYISVKLPGKIVPDKGQKKKTITGSISNKRNW